MRPEPAVIAMYADVHCPYAYVNAYRRRQLQAEWRGKVRIVHKSLALEYVNRRPTPKPILDNETPIVMYRGSGDPLSALAPSGERMTGDDVASI